LNAQKKHNEHDYPWKSGCFCHRKFDYLKPTSFSEKCLALTQLDRDYKYAGKLHKAYPNQEGFLKVRVYSTVI